MYRNAHGILRGALFLVPRPLTFLRVAPHSRTISWAPSFGVLLPHRSCASIQPTNAPLSPISESAVVNLVETQNRILRSFSAEAALDHRDTAVIEEESRAVTVHKQEREVKKGTKGSKSSAGRAAIPEARIIDDSLHPIRQQDIPRGAWTALLKLRGAGHEGYLVGGAVRDLLLGAQPKDFDILTTATPVQVKRLFGRCQIVGTRFPIALVHSGGLILEVSSFGTKAKREMIPTDAAAFLSTPVPKRKGSDRPARALPAQQHAASWSSARQANAQSRDFTVNALMLDPFSLLIYDYSGGIKDCSKRVLRSIGNPSESLRQDPARIFRAIRHAARCGLSIEKGTGQAIEAHREGIMQLPESRVRMEAEALFGYGSAAASLRLLWRYRLLDVLLPQLAKRFTKAKLPRSISAAANRKEPILGMLEELDAEVEPSRPVDWTVWAAVMAAPIVDEALSSLLKAEQKAAKARRGAPAAEEDGRKRKRRREDSEDTDSAHQALEATLQEAQEEQREHARCRRAGAKAHTELGLAMTAAVKQLLRQGMDDGVEKSILPAAQWVRAAHLLKAAVDSVDDEQPTGYTCKESKDQSYAKGVRRADMDLLLDVLDNKPVRWREQRDQVAALYQ